MNERMKNKTNDQSSIFDVLNNKSKVIGDSVAFVITVSGEIVTEDSAAVVVAFMSSMIKGRAPKLSCSLSSLFNVNTARPLFIPSWTPVLSRFCPT